MRSFACAWILALSLFGGARPIPGIGSLPEVEEQEALRHPAREPQIRRKAVPAPVDVQRNAAPSTLGEARILIWGIVGAVLLRAAFVVGGAALFHRFHWLIYVLGAFLIVTGVTMLVKRGEADPTRNPVLRLFRRIVPMSQQLDDQKFFTRIDGRLAATPPLLVLLVVETTDALFAVDSIPAIFAVTTDPFIVFTSNVFANPGAAVALLSAGGGVGPLPVPQVWPVPDPLVRGPEDAALRRGEDPCRPLPRDDRGQPGRVDLASLLHSKRERGPADARPAGPSRPPHGRP